MNQQKQLLQDEDLLNTILADLKRASREYTTAVTESNCPMVREKFQALLQDTLLMQERVYTFMSQHGMYSAPSLALEPEINKQLQQCSQTQMQTNQFVQQHVSMQ